jgi:hypothetical protein
VSNDARKSRRCLESRAPEGRGATFGDVVEVAQDGAYALPTVGAKGPASIRMRVNAVVVLDVALAIRVSRDLRQLHMAPRLASERLDFGEQERAWMGLLGEVARQTRAPLGCFATCNGVRFRALQKWPGSFLESFALLFRQEILDDVDRGLIAHFLQAWIVEIERHVLRPRRGGRLGDWRQRLGHPTQPSCCKRSVSIIVVGWRALLVCCLGLMSRLLMARLRLPPA